MNHVHAIMNEVKKVISGKDQELLWILTAILGRGHVLMEDIPGVGKTTVALAFSRALGLRYGRVQFTPDVLPSDITGYSIYQKETGQLRYQPGAILCNLFLADELNRATSRTQSALLEAMEEGQVTVDGATYRLPEPFIVFATQNPTGAAGTQLLPDSQMDRFSIRLSLGYPSREAELDMVQRRLSGNPLDSVCQVAAQEELEVMRQEVEQVHVSDTVLSYLVNLVRTTRDHPQLARGASPRATLSLTALSKAVAYIRGRDFVIPEDVRITYPHALAHRLLLTADAEAKGITAENILQEIARRVTAPKL